MRMEQPHSPDNLFAPEGQKTAGQPTEFGGSTSKRKEMEMTDVKSAENPGGVSGGNQGRFMGRFAHCFHAPRPFFHTGKVHRAKLGRGMQSDRLGKGDRHLFTPSRDDDSHNIINLREK